MKKDKQGKEIVAEKLADCCLYFHRSSLKLRRKSRDGGSRCLSTSCVIPVDLFFSSSFFHLCNIPRGITGRGGIKHRLHAVRKKLIVSNHFPPPLPPSNNNKANGGFLFQKKDGSAIDPVFIINFLLKLKKKKIRKPNYPLLNSNRPTVGIRKHNKILLPIDCSETALIGMLGHASWAPVTWWRHYNNSNWMPVSIIR